MDDDPETARLKKTLNGTCAQVVAPRKIWAHGASLTDDHIASLAGWANVELLMADETEITNSCLTSLFSFPLVHLSVGATQITSTAILQHVLPASLRSFGVSEINFDDCDLSSFTACQHLEVVNANDCNLSEMAIRQLAGLPRLFVLEAYSARLSTNNACKISHEHPEITFRFNEGIWKAGKLINPHLDNP